MLKNSWSLFSALLTALTLCFSSAVYAETYHFVWTPSLSAGNTTAGVGKKFDITFDSESNQIQWIVRFSKAPNTNYLPDGFQLAFNNGPNPKGYAGELAFFYFDALNHADPKLTVYAYNSVNESSWSDGSPQSGAQPADKILSSEAAPGSAKNPTGWIKQLIAYDDDEERVLGFIIDGTKINTHTPLYPGGAGNPWKGAQFDLKIGMWFHPVKGLSTTYGADGFLTNWYRSIRGFYDTANQNAFIEDPICQAISGSGHTVVNVGTPFQAKFKGIDNQQQNLKVTYSGLPPGATVTPANNSTNSNPVNVTINWTPNGSHHGKSYNVDVTFTDTVGAKATCPFSVSVPVNKIPVCNAGAAAAYQNLACSAETTGVQLDGSASKDTDNSGPLTYLWTTNCPGGVISSPTAQKPSLTLNSSNADGSPVACTVYLQVSDGYSAKLCSAAVSINGCVRDCEGTINGVKVFDVCNICGGDGTSCLDCAGTPFGTAKVDRCGVCGGNDACVDCLDNPFGTATIDRCGVCEGDGTSCLGCTNKDITATLMELDGGAHKQRNLVKLATVRLKKTLLNTTTKAFSKKALREAERLRQENWRLAWSVARVQTVCSNTVFCASVSNQDILDEYRTNAATLRDIALQVMNELKTLKPKLNKGDKRLLRKIEEIFSVTTSDVNSVPATSSVCL
ncbi:MAG: hypothetical protein J5J00_16305 [Deltaproteobacteria bacterium]|nr:hypothetical protein [Deltaproteobacteria bacterium]